MTLAAWVDPVVVQQHVDGVGLPTLEPYANAAAAYVERNRPDLFVVDAPAPGSDVQLGVALLTARLYARRGTALGTADYDAGVYTVLRTDPDLARLLGLAWHGLPSCG